MAEIICSGKSTREINLEVRNLIAQGETDLLMKAPGARHNLGVAVVQPVRMTFDGSVGYYCAGLIDGPTVNIKGSAGWGLAESMMSGTVVVEGNAGNGAAASIRGGAVVIYGNAAARLGASMKGGLILVTGNAGYMAGFMGQRGTLIVCGDTGEAFADSMYATTCFVGGRIAELGNDTVIEEPTEADLAFLDATLSRHVTDHPPLGNFRKVLSGRKLWNFDKEERAVWREAL